MAIDKMIGSQININNEQRLNTNVTTDRPTITLNENKIEEAVEGNRFSHYTISKSNVEDAIGKMNDFLSPTRRNLKFELHDKLEKYYVSVVDSTTNEVIKEIPPKKFLDMYAAMAEYMGILVDKKI